MLVNFSTDALYFGSSKAHPEISLDKVAVIVLAGGEGKRLNPLTTARCKPAMSFGGRYSLIDVPISHSLASGLKNIFVIGQYLAYTLQKHLVQTYLHHGIAENKIQMLVPEERKGEKVWYEGTADSVRKNLDYFRDVSADYFLILSGDQLYNIDFSKMLSFAAETDAGMVIAAQPVNEKDAKRMGLLRIEEGGTQLIDFVEKPQEKDVLDQFFTDEFTLHRMGYDPKFGRNYLGSMGIYLFKRQTLFDLLSEDPRDDFGKHLITTQMQKKDVHAFLYDGYWEDIGTIESYYNANLALTRIDDDRRHGLQCYDEKYMLITRAYGLPGAKVTRTKVDRSLLCEGAIVEAEEITHSIIGVRSVIQKGTVIRDTIIIGNEYYDRPPLATGQPGYKPGIGENCLITKAIIDENVSIGNNVQLTNRQNLTHYDSPPGEPELFVRDGIIIVPRGTRLPSGFTF